jgi:hypothetical protein
METVMLTLKYIEFVVMELSVVAIFGGVLVAGLYQIVRDKVRAARQGDEFASKTA